MGDIRAKVNLYGRANAQLGLRIHWARILTSKTRVFRRDRAGDEVHLRWLGGHSASVHRRRRTRVAVL